MVTILTAINGEQNARLYLYNYYILNLPKTIYMNKTKAICFHDNNVGLYLYILNINVANILNKL